MEENSKRRTRRSTGRKPLNISRNRHSSPSGIPQFINTFAEPGFPSELSFVISFFASSSGMNLQNITPPQAKPNAAYAAHRAKELISILQPPLPQYRPPHSGLCRRAAFHAFFPLFVCRLLSSTLPKPLHAHSQHVSKARER